jgi:hypothetical protein
MEQIEISIHGLDARSEALQQLDKPDSGFKLASEDQELEFREPLHSAFGEAAVFVGLVLNIAKLAETIYQLLQTKAAFKKASRGKKRLNKRRVEVGILTAKGSRVFLRGSAKEVEAILRKELGNGK